MQAVDRLLPAPAIDQVVPVRDDVAERAALVAEGDAAIHASRPLRAQLVLRHLEIVLAPVLQSLAHRAPCRRLALDLHESRYFAHLFRQHIAPSLIPRDYVLAVSLITSPTPHPTFHLDTARFFYRPALFTPTHRPATRTSWLRPRCAVHPRRKSFARGVRSHRGQARHVVTRAEMLALEHRAILGRHHADEFREIA